MIVNLSPLGGAGWQFFDNSGVPLTGGLIYTYAAGGTTPLITYTSNTGLTPHANPIILDSTGRVNEIWVAEGVSHKFVIKTSTGTTIGTYDNLSPIATLPVTIVNGGTGATTALQARTNLGLDVIVLSSGTIAMWPTITAPSSWLLCDGSAVSRITYDVLFSIIGTDFGAGNGSTTFNLPNYKNRMPYGADIAALAATGGSADAIVVSHNHTAASASTSTSTSSVSDPGHVHNTPNGEGSSADFYPTGNFDGNRADRNWNTSSATTGISVSTSTSTSTTTTNTATGASGTNANLPPYLAINFIIKI